MVITTVEAPSALPSMPKLQSGGKPFERVAAKTSSYENSDNQMSKGGEPAPNKMPSTLMRKSNGTSPLINNNRIGPTVRPVARPRSGDQSEQRTPSARQNQLVRPSATNEARTPSGCTAPARSPTVQSPAIKYAPPRTLQSAP